MQTQALAFLDVLQLSSDLLRRITRLAHLPIGHQECKNFASRMDRDLSIHYKGERAMSDNSWENSPEYDAWIESGGRDEDYSDYYNKWDRRVNR